MGREESRLEKLPGCLEPLFSQVMAGPWYDKEQDEPEYLELSHDKVKAHLSQDVQPGGSLTVHIQPPGREVGGRDCAAIGATYEVLDAPGTSGEVVGRVNAIKVRNYMVTSRKYRAEVLSGDTVQLWPTAQQDHFVMGLIKEVCWVCSRETGQADYGLAYICDGCNKSIHAKCAGLRRNLGEEEAFFCRRCRPTVAADTIGEDADEKAAAAADEGAGVQEEVNVKEEEMEAKQAAGAELKEAGASGKPAGTAKGKGKGKEKEIGGTGKRKAGKGGEGEAADAKVKRPNKGAAKAAAKEAAEGGEAGPSQTK